MRRFPMLLAPLALLIALFLVACGNKGPLVRAVDADDAQDVEQTDDADDVEQDSDDADEPLDDSDPAEDIDASDEADGVNPAQPPPADPAHG